MRRGCSRSWGGGAREEGAGPRSAAAGGVSWSLISLCLSLISLPTWRGLGLRVCRGSWGAGAGAGAGGRQVPPREHRESGPGPLHTEPRGRLHPPAQPGTVVTAKPQPWLAQRLLGRFCQADRLNGGATVRQDAGPWPSGQDGTRLLSSTVPAKRGMGGGGGDRSPPALLASVTQARPGQAPVWEGGQRHRAPARRLHRPPLSGCRSKHTQRSERAPSGPPAVPRPGKLLRWAPATDGAALGRPGATHAGAVVLQPPADQQKGLQ